MKEGKMEKFNVGEILTRAWQIVWKNKVLWIFGILASCARGSGGSSSGGNNSSYRNNGSGNTPFSTGQLEQGMNQAVRFLENNWLILLAIGLGLVLFSIIIYSIGIMGRIGLIRGIAQADKGAEKLSFGELWSESLPYFWRVFGMNILLSLIFLVILVPFFLFGIITAGIGLLCLIPILCILIPVSWVAMVVIEQGQAAVIFEGLSMMDGFKRGWEIVKANAVPMVIMALILGIGGGIVSVVISLPILIAVIPAVIGVATIRETLTPLYIAAACCLAYFPILLVLNGVLTAYIQSAWTLTYLRLTSQKEEAPVIIEANA